MSEYEPIGPLSGVRVLDPTSVFMGRSATQMLGDLGADVIKVETREGDATRRMGPGGEVAMGPIYLGLNRNKRSIVLDLKKSAGLATLKRLLLGVDVLTSNVRPAGLARLGLTSDELSRINKRLIYISMVDFSQEGRYAEFGAFDDLIQAATGLPWMLAASGDDVPRFVPLSIAGRSVGLYAFGVICSALYVRERAGVGQQIDVPMFETILPYILGNHFWGGEFVLRRGNFGCPRLTAKSRVPYKTTDGYICCTPYTDQHWKSMLKLMGKADIWENDPRLATMASRTAAIDYIYDLVSSVMPEPTTAEWLEMLRAADIPVFPVHTPDTLLDDPHLQDVGFFGEIEMDGVGTIIETTVPSEWTGTPPSNYRTPPKLGEHSDNILREAGFSYVEIASLHVAGAIEQRRASLSSP